MFKGRRFTPALIVAMIALAVALSGTAVAGTAKLITSGQIANGTIKLTDLHSSTKSALKGQRGAKGDTGATGATGAKGDAGATGAAGAKGDTGATGAAGAKGDTGATGAAGAKGDTGATGAAGAKGDTGATGAAGAKGDAGATGAAGAKGDAGATGAAGAKGDKGEKGDTGMSGYEVRTWRYSKDASNTDEGSGYVGVGPGAIATVACSDGKVALGGGYRFTSQNGGGFNPQAIGDGSGVVASFPGRMDWNTNTVKHDNNTGWIVQVNDRVNAADMTLYVICVNAN